MRGKCVCGTEYPDEDDYEDWDAGCRHCERAVLNRMDAAFIPL